MNFKPVTPILMRPEVLGTVWPNKDCCYFSAFNPKLVIHEKISVEKNGFNRIASVIGVERKKMSEITSSDLVKAGYSSANDLQNDYAKRHGRIIDPYLWVVEFICSGSSECDWYQAEIKSLKERLERSEKEPKPCSETVSCAVDRNQGWVKHDFGHYTIPDIVHIHTKHLDFRIKELDTKYMFLERLLFDHLIMAKGDLGKEEKRKGGEKRTNPYYVGWGWNAIPNRPRRTISRRKDDGGYKD